MNDSNSPSAESPREPASSEPPRESTVSPSPKQPRKWKKWCILLLLLLVAVGGYTVWYNVFRQVDRHFDSVVELFKYGSVGNEDHSGIPYYLWQALPRVFPEKLPEGDGTYAAFGFSYEPGKRVPMGITRETIGFDRVGNNCAMCHMTTWRETPDDERHFYLSGTKTIFDAQAYFRFLFDCSNDPKFNAKNLMPIIEQIAEDEGTPLSFAQKILYRSVMIGQVKKEMKKMQDRLSWWDEVPDVGPGRWIAFNDLKYHFAKVAQDGGVGNPDVPSLWNTAPRQKYQSFHWDGLSDSVDKIIQNACVGGGSVEETIPRDDMQRLRDWWMELPPPQYPFQIDKELAAQGEPVWKENCASCHEIGQPDAGKVVPIDQIGTDRHRYDMMTAETVEKYNAFCKKEYGWPEEWQIRKTEGYTAMFLDGIWARAPFLHNGSVPTLADLLKKPDERPIVFYRGYDVYDKENVGFMSQGSAAEKEGFQYDTSLPANGNGGHTYGTDLGDDEKLALVEYMKGL